MKKRLALGHQEFKQVISNNCIYVDKTEHISTLIDESRYYFLSRPRRFGKSLLCNTIKELFLGNKDLFKGLWIYDKYNWEEKYPVIKISFAAISHEFVGLEKAIGNELDLIASTNNIKLTDNDIAYKFKELITKLAKQKQVVIIIDEYDKPIVDYLADQGKAEKNRAILQGFYSVIKDLDDYIRFFFVTGVSKFSKVSIFSKLNNLIDITLNPKFAEIVGWTEKEVVKYFPGYIQEVQKEHQDIYSDILPEIRKWYNGYSWDGLNTIYNPVSLMSLFFHQYFGNFWFETGTPTFLLNIIREKAYTPKDIELSNTTYTSLDKYEINNFTLLALLFQTGYLTIKNIDKKSRRITLGYPNQEVEEAFSKYFLSELSTGKIDRTENILFEIQDGFIDNNIEKVIDALNVLFKDIPYAIIERKENYFHSLFYLVIKLLGFQIDAEVLTSDGRIDAVIKTDTQIFILEFKVDQTSQVAIQQIKDKGYASKYLTDKRPKKLLGVNFNSKEKKINDFAFTEV